MIENLALVHRNRWRNRHGVQRYIGTRATALSNRYRKTEFRGLVEFRRERERGGTEIEGEREALWRWLCVGVCVRLCARVYVPVCEFSLQLASKMDWVISMHWSHLHM